MTKSAYQAKIAVSNYIEMLFVTTELSFWFLFIDSSLPLAKELDFISLIIDISTILS